MGLELYLLKPLLHNLSSEQSLHSVYIHHTCQRFIFEGNKDNNCVDIYY